MNQNMNSMFKHALYVYEYFCRPVCKKYNIQQPALDILLFLDKNPHMNTAVDIQKGEGFKQSFVSFHVDRLVSDGFLERQPVPGDRRKVHLICTEKANEVIAEGKAVKQQILARMSEGITKEEQETVAKVFRVANENLSKWKEEIAKGVTEL